MEIMLTGSLANGQDFENTKILILQGFVLCV